MRNTGVFLSSSLVILLFVAACRTASVYDVNSQVFASELTKEQARRVIISGGTKRGWQVRDDGPGRIVATLTLRKHFAAVDITYDEKSFSITYKDSRYLWYNGTRIHKNYNSWVSNLSKTIQQYARLPEQLHTISSASTERPPKTKESTGTGFFVSQDGHALTNAHVVDECEKLVVTIPGGLVANASVVAQDKTNDLAALKVTTVPEKWAKFRSGAGARPGDRAVAFGFPLSGALSSKGNVTTGNISALAGLGDDTRYYQISTPVQPGNSGGPLMDVNGNIIGVITSKLNAVLVAQYTGDIPQNVNFALKATLAKAFLDSNGISYASMVAGKELSTADIAEGAKGFTVRIDCFR